MVKVKSEFHDSSLSDDEGSEVQQVELIVILLAVVGMVGAISQKVRIALPILLVVAGMIISLIPQIPVVRLEPDVVFFMFLPPLLYIDSFNTPWKRLKDVGEIISLQAVGLVLVTVSVVAAAIHAVIPDISWAAAFVFGAIVSPTDAVAAQAIAKEVQLPRKLMDVIKGESLANDATGLVAYQFAVAAAVTGVFSLSAAGEAFLYMSIGGIVVGTVLGLILSKIRTELNHRPVEIISSFLSPFIVYLTATHIHVSGVLAVVIAGLILGWHGPKMLSSMVRLQTKANWDTIVYILNGFSFLLMGLQLKPILATVKSYPLHELLIWTVTAAIAPIVIRFVWAYITTPIYSLFKKEFKLNWKYLFIFSWCGMRGVLSLATALALPLVCANGQPFPYRDLLVFLTIVVIVTTLILQGISLPYIVKKFGFDFNTDDAEERERQTRLALSREAVRSIDELARNKELDLQDPALHRILNRYLQDALDNIQLASHNMAKNQAWELLETEAIKARRRMLILMRENHEIEEDFFQVLQNELDLEEAYGKYF